MQNAAMNHRPAMTIRFMPTQWPNQAADHIANSFSGVRLIGPGSTLFDEAFQWDVVEEIRVIRHR